MTDLEKIMNAYLKNIYVSIPCQIKSLSGMYATVKPLIYDDLDFPVITSVPILFIGNSSKKLKFKSSVGDIVTVFFTQLDLGKFLAYGTTGQVNSTERFNLTNAFALPFNVFPKTNGETMPTVDFEMIGDLNIIGNVNITGTLDTTGDISTDSNCSIAGTCVADGVSVSTHTHTAQGEYAVTTTPN